MKAQVTFVLALALVGCHHAPPKDAAGHVIGTPMGDAAPRYVAGQPVGAFLKGTWEFGYAQGNREAVSATKTGMLAQSLTFEADGDVTSAMQGAGGAVLTRRGTWRLVGNTVTLAFDPRRDDAHDLPANPVEHATDRASQIGIAAEMSTLYASSLEIAPGDRRLTVSMSAAALRNDPALGGGMVWLRVAPAESAKH